jgi:hypothetical protein
MTPEQVAAVAVNEAEVHRRTKSADGTDSPLVSLLIEDDGHWHQKVSFDAARLDDLNAVLEVLSARLKPKKRAGKRKGTQSAKR